MRSKFMFLGGVALCLSVVLAGAASAGGEPVRTEQQSYRGLSHIAAGPLVFHPGPTRVLGDFVFGGVVFETRNRERFLNLEIRDAAGAPILAYVEATAPRRQGTGEASEVGRVCGSSDKPLRFRPGSRVFVYLSAEGCGGAPSVPTEGTIVARFSR